MSLYSRAALFAALAALCACVGRSESRIGTAGTPLVVLVSPAHAPADADQLRVLEYLLSSQTGMSVVVQAAPSPVEAIELFGRRMADAGLLTLDEALLAKEEYGVEFGLQVLRGKGEKDYDGVILVQAKDKAKSVADLKGKPFGFTDPYSVSGFLLPVQHLQKAGVEVEREFLGGHAKALQALLEGGVAAVATYEDAAKAKGVRVLARTGTVPNEPVAFRRGLRIEKREALMKALKLLPESDEGRKALLAAAGITGFGPVEDGAYRMVHERLQEAEKTVYDLVPGGDEIRRLNQPYVDVR